MEFINYKSFCGLKKKLSDKRKSMRTEEEHKITDF